MYGKHFDSMYRGSMIGSGAMVFAVWGYVIANYKLDRNIGAQVELNPVLLSAILGEKEKDIEDAIRFLCSPDPRSRTKVKEGRRLVKLGEFDYQVVNGEKYTLIKNEEMRREQNRIAQAKYRAAKKLGQGLKGESASLKARENGLNDTAEKIEAESLAALKTLDEEVKERDENFFPEPPLEILEGQKPAVTAADYEGTNWLDNKTP